MRIRCILVISSALVLARAAIRQIEVRAKYEGAWSPVVAASGDHVEVMKDGKRKEVWRGEVQMKPAAEFGPGMMKIDNVVADHDPQKNAKSEERSRPDQVHFRYTD